MLITDIVRGVNNMLDGEQLSYRDLRIHLDSVIDDINQQLNACFPAFTELPLNTVEYNCFPDRYIRTCVIRGAAYYFYMTDEEGATPPPGYERAYLQNLFFMLRDYLRDIPAKYQADDVQGTVEFNIYQAPKKHCPYRTPDEPDTDAEDIVVKITIGNTITLPAGSQAAVTNSGTETEPVLNFAIPEGQVGPMGPQGLPGATGGPGIQGVPGPAGSDGTYRSIKNITLLVAGWAAVAPQQLADLELASTDEVPTHAYVLSHATPQDGDSAFFFGPEPAGGLELFRKCLIGTGSLTFFAMEEPTADILVDAVVLF